MEQETYNHLTKEMLFYGYSIAIWEETQQLERAEHSHDYTELVVVYEGNGINTVDGYDYPVSAGEVFVIHEGIKHSYRNTKNLHLCNVMFDSPLLETCGVDISHLPGFHALFRLEPKMRKTDFNSRLHLPQKELMEARGIIERLTKELAARTPGFRLITQSLLFLLIGKLARWFDLCQNENTARLMQIAQPIAYMEQHYYEPLAIEKLAAMAGISERAFFRIFQQATGASPNQYQNNLRLIQVAELLRHSDMPVADIADECGFLNSSYMAKQFRKQMNMTPREFRNLHQS
ncbi:helix-turn-helix domain-containing protein [Pontiella desulfatans]|uniref:helix-turn-helix domain-containing protein n=1 Tax=Pontiella desulfatans TaxID=2750659 RepID=UPI00109D064F|nr:AraC family transcriptional regulator [Pontiella desulfatans]